jgi:hypothetical protein
VQDPCFAFPKEEGDEPLSKKPKKIMMSLANEETSRLFNFHGLNVEK